MRALITGGSKGIGRALALRLARSGDDVLINYHTDVAAAEATAAEVSAAGGRARLVRADACSLDGISELATEARSILGELDLLVHCAITAFGGSALAAPEADFRDSVEKNGLSFLWLVRASRPCSQPARARFSFPVEGLHGLYLITRPSGWRRRSRREPCATSLPRWRRTVCESTQCLRRRSIPRRSAR